MFELELGMLAFQIKKLELEGQRFDAARASMPPEEFITWFDAMRRVEEKQRQEALAEHRRQEICLAIRRSPSFWRF